MVELRLPEPREPEVPAITLVLHKFSRGGSDRVAAYLARGFTDRGLPTELVVFTRGGEVEGLLAELTGADIPIHYLGNWSGPRPLDLVRGLPALVRHLRGSRAKVIISTANNTALVTAIAHWLARSAARLYLKTTNPVASSRHRGVKRRLRNATYRFAFGRSDGVWTLSAPEVAEMKAEFPQHCGLFRDVVNPYVTSAMLAPLTGEPHRSTEQKTIICIARLTAQKRLDRVIAAFVYVRSAGARLVIVGEGEDRPALAAQITALRLSDRVTMPGYVADVASALRGANLFVLTSDYEGLPAVLLEAMAANLPVLSTDCFPAAHSLLDCADGCGLIVDPSPAALALQIDLHLALPRPVTLRAIAERYSINNGVLSHLAEIERAASIDA